LAEYLNVREAARLLRVHENTIRNWCDQGFLVAERMPGSRFRRITVESVEALTTVEQVPRHGCWEHFDAMRLHDCSACRDAATLFDTL